MAPLAAGRGPVTVRKLDGAPGDRADLSQGLTLWILLLLPSTTKSMPSPRESIYCTNMLSPLGQIAMYDAKHERGDRGASPVIGRSLSAESNLNSSGPRTHPIDDPERPYARYDCAPESRRSCRRD